VGLAGRLPVSQANLAIGPLTLPAQEAAVDLLLGMTFDFD
jgi:hypothetical protein